MMWDNGAATITGDRTVIHYIREADGELPEPAYLPFDPEIAMAGYKMPPVFLVGPAITKFRKVHGTEPYHAHVAVALANYWHWHWMTNEPGTARVISPKPFVAGDFFMFLGVPINVVDNPPGNWSLFTLSDKSGSKTIPDFSFLEDDQ